MDPKQPYKKFSSPTSGTPDKVQELKDVLEGKAAPHAALDASPEIEAQLEKIQAELKEAQEESLRIRADAQNFKKRMEREKEEMVKYSNEKLLNDILPILDNLEMTFLHASQAAGKAEAGTKDPILEGVGMVVKQFLATLEKFGLKSIEGTGEVFDPHRQEAIASVDAPDQAPGTVVSVHRKGFTLHGRLLRPAMVTIAKAPEGDSSTIH